jgi:putative oxidoreductase
MFVIFFLVSGVGGHIARGKMMEDAARSAGFPIPAVAGWPAGIWLVAAAISIAFGIWPDVGALMVAAFVVPVAAYFHRFWEVDEQQKVMQQ